MIGWGVIKVWEQEEGKIKAICLILKLGYVIFLLVLLGEHFGCLQKQKKIAWNGYVLK